MRCRPQLLTDSPNALAPVVGGHVALPCGAVHIDPRRTAVVHRRHATRSNCRPVDAAAAGVVADCCRQRCCARCGPASRLDRRSWAAALRGRQRGAACGAPAACSPAAATRSQGCRGRRFCPTAGVEDWYEDCGKSTQSCIAVAIAEEASATSRCSQRARRSLV